MNKFAREVKFAGIINKQGSCITVIAIGLLPDDYKMQYCKLQRMQKILEGDTRRAKTYSITLVLKELLDEDLELKYPKIR